MTVRSHQMNVLLYKLIVGRYQTYVDRYKIFATDTMSDLIYTGRLHMDMFIYSIKSKFKPPFLWSCLLFYLSDQDKHDPRYMAFYS